MKTISEYSSTPLSKNELPSIFALSQAELNEFLIKHNFSQFIGPIIFQSLYKNKKDQELSPLITKKLNEEFDFYLPEINKISKSDDGTVKFLLSLKDGKLVETVLIPFHKKYTICLSSQVGCAMNCSFCYTGKMGLKRHLKTEEIIGQYLVAFNYLKQISGFTPATPNIVFMGQGEPLHNPQEVKKSILIFTEQKGLAIGPRQITLSTAGYLPGIKYLHDFPQINIALSLHSAINEKRNELIPINQHFPIEDIIHEIDKLPLKKRQFITYEYLLIKDFNDRDEDALKLAQLLSSKKAIINLIAFNPFPGSHYKRPETGDVLDFKQKLISFKLRTMIRTTKGSEVLAACGQLNTRE